MRRLANLCLLVLLIGGMSMAQESLPSEQTQILKSLLERVNALENEVKELKQQNQQLLQQASGTKAAPPTSAAPPAESTTTQEAMQQQAIVPPPEAAAETYPNLKIRGFGDVDFTSTDSRSQTNGFSMGQFVLHFSSALSQKTSFFGELSFTAQPSGYNADVERAIIRYDWNDYLKVSFGRYHTPVNYWNTAFHHGAWLQTTIARPEMIRFGGRFLPVHFVGALAEGAIPSGSLGLNYNFGVGNGRQTIPLLGRDGDPGDVNSNRAIVGEIFARPSWVDGLQFGGSFYKDKISPDPLAVDQSQYREWIGSAHVVYTRETPEIMAEFSNVRHRNIFTNQTWDSQAAYGQIAYRLPWAAKKLKPYYRFEYIHIPAGEPVLLIPELRAGHTVGTRYDITDFAAFKLEYRNWRRSETDKFQGVFAQTSFTF